MALVRLILTVRLGLFNDEAYYWEWSRHLAPSYYDHPPLVAYLIAASTRLFGRTVFAVHFPALALSVATTLVLGLFAADLFPGRPGVVAWTLLAANACPLFGLGAVFTTPDAPCTFFWILTAFLVWRALHGEKGLFLLAGMSAGLGMLSKYNFVLLPLALLLYLAHKERRRWLGRKEPYLAAALMLLGLLPVLLWNATHDWASFRFQFVDRHLGPFQPLSTLRRYLVAQQSVSPLIWLACLAGTVRSYLRARRGDEAHALLFACTATVLGFFGAWSFFTWVNPNWCATAFLTAIVSAAELMDGLGSRALRMAPIALGAALTLLFYAQALWLLLPIPPKVDFATDLTGWDEVGARLRLLKSEMPDPARTFVYSGRFQLSALAAFYGGEGLFVTRLGGRADEYDAWRGEAHLSGEDAIAFSDDEHALVPGGEPFKACEPAGTLPIVRRGRTIRSFSFWRCSGYAP